MKQSQEQAGQCIFSFYHTIAFASGVENRRAAVYWRLPVKCLRKDKYLRSITHCQPSQGQRLHFHFLSFCNSVTATQAVFPCLFAICQIAILMSVEKVRTFKYAEDWVMPRFSIYSGWQHCDTAATKTFIYVIITTAFSISITKT